MKLRIAFALLIAHALLLPACAQQWRRVGGIDSTRGVYSTAVHAGTFFAATDSLIYRSADGLAWQETARPVTGLPYYVLHANASGLFAGTDDLGVHRSTDGGATWTLTGSGLPAEDVIGLTSLGDSLYAGLGFSGVYVLNLRNPSAWTPYNTGLTQFGTNWIGVAGGTLFAGMGAGLFVRARGGPQWQEASWGDGLQRQAFEVAALDSFFFAATEAGVFRARAADPLSWQARDVAAMKGRDVLALAVQGKRIYAGLNQSQQHWIWSSDDAGATWDVRAHEFAEIWEMRFAGDRMWAARTDGLWYYDFASAALKPARRPPTREAAWVEPRLAARRLDGRRFRPASRASSGPP